MRTICTVNSHQKLIFGRKLVRSYINRKPGAELRVLLCFKIYINVNLFKLFCLSFLRRDQGLLGPFVLKREEDINHLKKNSKCFLFLSVWLYNNSIILDRVSKLLLFPKQFHLNPNGEVKPSSNINVYPIFYTEVKEYFYKSSVWERFYTL